MTPTTQISIKDKSNMLKSELGRRLDLIEKMLPPGLMSAQKFAQLIVQLCAQNQTLYDCNRGSLVSAVIQCASLGLSPDPGARQAYFVPFKGHVQFIPGYLGLKELAYKTGNVTRITMEPVHSGDHFVVRRGTDPKIEHWELPDTKAEQKVVTHVYATAKLSNGETLFHVMTVDEVEQARQRSPSSNSPRSPWRTDWQAMALKTAFRRLTRVMPMSGNDSLAKALTLDDTAEKGEVQYAGDFAVNNSWTVLGDTLTEKNSYDFNDDENASEPQEANDGQANHIQK